MLFANASAAVPIVANINSATAQTALIGQFTTDSAVVLTLSLVVQDPNNPQATNYSCSNLSISESATIFNAIFTVFNNRLTNYNSQLAALSG